MRIVKGVFLLLLLTAGAQAQHDPFYNPIKNTVRERLEWLKLEEQKKLQEQKQKVVLNKPVNVNIFKPVIPDTLDKYTIEGVVGEESSYYLVVTDPDTGRTFVLKEGDAVAPDMVISKITLDSVIFLKYVMDSGKLKKETVVLKVNTEG